MLFENKTASIAQAENINIKQNILDFIEFQTINYENKEIKNTEEQTNLEHKIENVIIQNYCCI